MKRITLISLCLLGLAGPVSAQVSALTLPAPATRTYEEAQANAAYAMPTGPWIEGRIENLPLTGGFTLETWRLSGSASATHDLMASLSAQLSADGYETLFQCDQNTCGGFDFRFGIKVASEPFMHVDLGDYLFLSAHRPSPEDRDESNGNSGDYASLLVSRSPGAGFVQITRIGTASQGISDPNTATVTSTMTNPTTGAAALNAPITQQLEQNGYAVLGDLVFETGSSKLDAGPFDSLAQLATFMSIHPEFSIALVGHTDAEGSLDGNIALSKRRAASVRARLIELHALAGGRVTAQGVGFLAPLSTNQTETGRTQNRRVEVVLTSTP